MNWSALFQQMWFSKSSVEAEPGAPSKTNLNWHRDDRILFGDVYTFYRDEAKNIK
jgi:hypothetical protein